MKQTAFLRCFLTQERVLAIKHLTEKTIVLALLTNVRLVIDHTLPIQLQRLALLKTSR